MALSSKQNQFAAEYGIRYEQLLILYGKTGRPANVVAAWIMENGTPRLTSVYIKEAKGREN